MKVVPRKWYLKVFLEGRAETPLRLVPKGAFPARSGPTFGVPLGKCKQATSHWPNDC